MTSVWQSLKGHQEQRSLFERSLNHGRLSHAYVLTGPDGLVEWVNPAFTAMCGYEPGELLGKKPGSILQGKLTDEAAVLRIREALRDRRPCTEALVNYHKNGTPYWVSVNITPVHDDAGGLLCFIARELELTERAVAA